MDGNIEKQQTRAFTPKAIIAGLIGILLIAGGSEFSPTLAKQEILHHQLGIGIYFYFFLICLLWNPFCTRYIPPLAMNIKEMAVAFIMTLTAGGFAWFGWMRQFALQSAMIAHNMTGRTWQEGRYGEYINPDTLPEPGDDNINISEFQTGLERTADASPTDWMPISEIPYWAWEKPLIYWGAVILLVAVMSLALLMIVHRQWIRNEKLTYPLATVANSLFEKKDEKSCFADIFRSKLFWMAFIFVLIIHLYNFAQAADQTTKFKPIQMLYPLSGLGETFPIINKAGCGAIFSGVKIMFLIVGIAYFLAPALSLSVGLNGFVYLLFAAEVYEATGMAPTSTENQIFRAGAYLAFVIMMIILGRRYYGAIFWKAISWKRVTEEEQGAVFGARLFILSALLLVFVFTLFGMDIIMASATTLILIMMYLVFTRIVCEAGIPLMTSPFMPNSFLAKLFGGVALGPENLMASGQTSGVLCGDMKQLMMPYVATGMKVTDDAGIKLRRVGMVVMISIVIAFSVAVFMHIWQYYSLGSNQYDANKNAWANGLSDSTFEVSQLKINNQLNEPVNNAESTVKSRLKEAFNFSNIGARLKAIEPEKVNYVVYFVLGIAAVFITGFMRTRFLWWPFHAVIFCIWNTGPANLIWFSFLLGWFLRTIIVKLGGEKNYIKMKPLFLGLIFGEVAATGLFIISGLIFYLVTKNPTTISYQV